MTESFYVYLSVFNNTTKEPEAVIVEEVEAETAEEACRLAAEQGVTVRNQYGELPKFLFAFPCAKVDVFPRQ
jgi:hypothetical protein